MNERTHFCIKIYLSYLILERGCFLCVRGKLETGTDHYILTPSSSDHSSTSFAFWLGCSTLGHWGPKPSLWSWFSLRWHPISNWNWPKPSVAPGYIIVWHPPASAVPPLIYTGAPLDWRLGRGSIYNTISQPWWENMQKINDDTY